MAAKPLGADTTQLITEAKSRLSQAAESGTQLRDRPAEELLHELRVHQIELEMQNEELQLAQQIIEQSRDRYLDLYDFAPIGYLTLNRAAVIVEANLTSADLFGVTRKELLDRRFANFVSPDERKNWSRQFMDKFIHVMEHGDKQGCELALRRADGAVFHARLDCLRIDRSGEAPVARIALTDITERRLAQQHLARLVESAMDAIISIDEKQRIVVFNPAAESMFGLTAAEALGQPIELLLPEGARLGHAAHIRSFAGSGETNRNLKERAGLRGRRSNGELFLIEATLSQVEVQGNELYTVILRDITERTRIETSLLETRNDLNRAQSVGQIGSWRLNVQCNELLWSPENHRIFGIPQGMPLTYDIFLAIVHPDDREYVDRMWQAGLHGAPYDIQHRIVVNGEMKWVREKSELEFNAMGQLLSAFGTTQEITQLKLAELALVEADRRKDEFLAMLGHELRNPLAPIRNAAHVLARLQSPEPQVRWAHEIIEQQVAHLTRLVDDLLDVSRIVRGKVTLQPETLSLASVVHHALDMTQPLIAAKRHQLDLHLPETPVWLQGDRVRLAQVLCNLLDNAVKYTPEGGCLWLSANVVGGHVEIRMRDNGVGISDALRPRIFDLFQQGERTLDRAQGGQGIGLTLAKQLVELHGGQIEAASAGPGSGSEFTLRLPVMANLAAATTSHMAQPPSATSACRIMVVDDDPAVADSMAALLQIEGHAVRTAFNGIAALALAQDFHPRLVLLDIGLGGMDGYEVARRLRAQQRADEKLCLVAVTGYGHDEARAQARAAGFDLHLVKPVFPEAICELLGEISRQQLATSQ
jgi:PAS domain S-box-containing protein